MGHLSDVGHRDVSLVDTLEDVPCFYKETSLRQNTPRVAELVVCQ